MTDEELNRRVAVELGKPGCNVPGCLNHLPWATSLDACFRDLVPEAEGRGWAIELQVCEAGFTWRFYDTEHELGFMDLRVNTDPIPARALCLAWLATKEGA